MKKVILSVTTVVLAALSAHAQSAGVEVRMADQTLRGAFVKTQPRRTDAAVRARPNNWMNQLTQQIQRQQAQQTVACDTTTQAPTQPATRSTANTTPRVTPATATPANKGSVGQWLKAIFLGGRFPGESADAYHYRLVSQSQPASLPFK